MSQIIETQISPGPIRTIRTKTAITSAFNPISSTWISMGSWVQTGLIDAGFEVSRIVWNTQWTDGFLESGGSTADTRVNLTTSQIEIPGATGSTVTTLTHATSWRAPYLAIEADVVAGFGSGSTRQFRLSYGDGSTGFFLSWDEAAGTVTLNKADSGLTVLATYTGALTGPFTFGLSISNLSLSAQIKYTTSQWSTLITYDIPSNDSLDPRQPARLTACNRVTLGWTTAGNNGATFKLGEVRCGYVAGVNGLADQPFCISDGTPIQKGGEQFIVYSNSAVPGSNTTAIPTALFQIMAVDATRNQMKCVAKVFTNNAATGITGNNSGCVIYHPLADKYYWVIPNYGDQAVVGVSEPLYMNLYTTNAFPSGIVVLENPVRIVVPQSATKGVGDPCLRWNLGGNGLWNFIYAVYDSGYSAYNPSYVTIPSLANVGTAGNWTQVAVLTSGSDKIEGIKFIKVGGTQYIIATKNFTAQAVYDLTLTQLGSITDPEGAQNKGSHACWLLYPEGNGGQRVYWLFFDGTEYGTPNYTHGRTRFVKSTVLQAGQDFNLTTLIEA